MLIMKKGNASTVVNLSGLGSLIVAMVLIVYIVVVSALLLITYLLGGLIKGLLQSARRLSAVIRGGFKNKKL